MRISKVTLADEIAGLGPGIVCLTGGGGKTTLMYGLGNALADRGARVLLTTTTRIQRPTREQAGQYLETDDPDDIRLPNRPCAYAAARPATQGHNPDYPRGFDTDSVDLLWKRGAADWIIVEADGSACRPLKAPSEKEPVIPSLTRLTIAVIGLSGIGQIFSNEWVFRPEHFSSVSGLSPGDVITPAGVAKAVSHPCGLFKGTPPRACRAVFLNQADLPGCAEYGLATAEFLLQRGPVSLNRIYLGSARDGRGQCRRIDEGPAGMCDNDA